MPGCVGIMKVIENCHLLLRGRSRSGPISKFLKLLERLNSEPFTALHSILLSFGFNWNTLYGHDYRLYKYYKKAEPIVEVEHFFDGVCWVDYRTVLVAMIQEQFNGRVC